MRNIKILFEDGQIEVIKTCDDTTQNLLEIDTVRTFIQRRSVSDKPSHVMSIEETDMSLLLG